MEPELGVLLALLLNGSSAYKDSFGTLIRELLAQNNIPKRISWEGQEESLDEDELVKLLKHLPCDFLSQIMSYFKRATRDVGSGFLDDGVLSWNKYSELTGNCGRARSNKLVKYALDRTLGMAKGTFSDPSYEQYRLVKSITGHFLPVYCVHFDGPERRMISAGDDGIIRIWCLRTGLMVSSIRAHTACICDLSIDPRNKFLASCSLDQTIRIWDLETSAPLLLIQVDSPVLTIEFNPAPFEDGRHVILMCTGSDGYLRLWSIDMRRKVASEPPVKYFCKSKSVDTVRIASFSNAGARIVVGSTDGIIRLLKTPSREDIARGFQFYTYQPYVYFLEDHEGYVNCLHFSQDGAELVTAAWDGTVRLWTFDGLVNAWVSRPFSSLQARPEMPRKGRKVTMVSFVRNDQMVVAAVNELYSILVFSKASGELLRELKYHTLDIQVLSCHPVNDRIIMTASYDGSVAVWDIVTGRRLFEQRTTCKFLDGAFSPSGDYFSLTDDLGRISIFAHGVSEDAYALAPDVQLLYSDWMDAAFDENRVPIDPIAQRPGHLLAPRLTCGLERNPNPIVVRESFFPSAFDSEVSWMGSEAQRRQEAVLQRQLASENACFARELARCPPGIAPKHSRSRKKRIIYGSDIEEDPLAEDGDIRPAVQFRDEVEEGNGLADVEVVDEGRRSSRGGSARQLAAWLEEGEEEEVYDPSVERRTRHRTANRSREKANDDVDGPSEWLSIDDRRYSPYLPQLYDIVAYFPEGHRMFLEKETRKIFRETLPHYVTSTSRRTNAHVIAQIIDMQFYVLDERPWCQLTLAPLDETILLGSEEDRDSIRLDREPPGERFNIAYYDLAETPDFIILACRFQWSLNQEYSTGQLVRVLYGHEETYNGKVVHVGPRRRSAWQAYTVEWLSLEDPPEQCSPWELEPFEADESEGSRLQPYLCLEAIPTTVLRVLTEGFKHITESKHAAFLIDPVDYSLFPEYLAVVPYPMYLGLMLSRLENGFYRRLEAFLWDAQLVTTNALIFNEPDSDIVKDATAVYQMIEALVRRSQRPMRNSALRSSLGPTLLMTPVAPPNTSRPNDAHNPPSPDLIHRSSSKRVRVLESSSDDSSDENTVPSARRRSGRRRITQADDSEAEETDAASPGPSSLRRSGRNRN